VADARLEEGEESDGAPLASYGAKKVAEGGGGYDTADIPALIAQLETEMQVAAKELDFEAAARLRDQLFELRVRSGDTAGARTGVSSRAADPGAKTPARSGRGARAGRKSRGR
jgi:excinuclease ABC subunit B